MENGNDCLKCLRLSNRFREERNKHEKKKKLITLFKELLYAHDLKLCNFTRTNLREIYSKYLIDGEQVRQRLSGTLASLNEITEAYTSISTTSEIQEKKIQNLEGKLKHTEFLNKQLSDYFNQAENCNKKKAEAKLKAKKESKKGIKKTNVKVEIKSDPSSPTCSWVNDNRFDNIDFDYSTNNPVKNEVNKENLLEEIIDLVPPVTNENLSDVNNSATVEEEFLKAKDTLDSESISDSLQESFDLCDNNDNYDDPNGDHDYENIDVQLVDNENCYELLTVNNDCIQNEHIDIIDTNDQISLEQCTDNDNILKDNNEIKSKQSNQLKDVSDNGEKDIIYNGSSPVDSGIFSSSSSPATSLINEEESLNFQKSNTMDEDITSSIIDDGQVFVDTVESLTQTYTTEEQQNIEKDNMSTIEIAFNTDIIYSESAGTDHIDNFIENTNFIKEIHCETTTPDNNDDHEIIKDLNDDKEAPVEHQQSESNKGSSDLCEAFSIQKQCNFPKSKIILSEQPVQEIRPSIWKTESNHSWTEYMKSQNDALIDNYDLCTTLNRMKIIESSNSEETKREEPLFKKITTNKRISSTLAYIPRTGNKYLSDHIFGDIRSNDHYDILQDNVPSLFSKNHEKLFLFGKKSHSDITNVKGFTESNDNSFYEYRERDSTSEGTVKFQQINKKINTNHVPSVSTSFKLLSNESGYPCQNEVFKFTLKHPIVEMNNLKDNCVNVSSMNELVYRVRQLANDLERYNDTYLSKLHPNESYTRGNCYNYQCNGAAACGGTSPLHHQDGHYNTFNEPNFNSIRFCAHQMMDYNHPNNPSSTRQYFNRCTSPVPSHLQSNGNIFQNNHQCFPTTSRENNFCPQNQHHNFPHNSAYNNPKEPVDHCSHACSDYFPKSFQSNSCFYNLPSVYTHPPIENRSSVGHSVPVNSFHQETTNKFNFNSGQSPFLIEKDKIVESNGKDMQTTFTTNEPTDLSIKSNNNKSGIQTKLLNSTKEKDLMVQRIGEIKKNVNTDQMFTFHEDLQINGGEKSTLNNENNSEIKENSNPRKITINELSSSTKSTVSEITKKKKKENTPKKSTKQTTVSTTVAPPLAIVNGDVAVTSSSKTDLNKQLVEVKMATPKVNKKTGRVKKTNKLKKNEQIDNGLQEQVLESFEKEKNALDDQQNNISNTKSISPKKNKRFCTNGPAIAVNKKKSHNVDVKQTSNDNVVLVNIYEDLELSSEEDLEDDNNKTKVNCQPNTVVLRQLKKRKVRITHNTKKTSKSKINEKKSNITLEKDSINIKDNILSSNNSATIQQEIEKPVFLHPDCLKNSTKVKKRRNTKVSTLPVKKTISNKTKFEDVKHNSNEVNLIDQVVEDIVQNKSVVEAFKSNAQQKNSIEEVECSLDLGNKEEGEALTGITLSSGKVISAVNMLPQAHPKMSAAEIKRESEHIFIPIDNALADVMFETILRVELLSPMPEESDGLKGLEDVVIESDTELSKNQDITETVEIQQQIPLTVPKSAFEVNEDWLNSSEDHLTIITNNVNSEGNNIVVADKLTNIEESSDKSESDCKVIENGKLLVYQEIGRQSFNGLEVTVDDSLESEIEEIQQHIPLTVKNNTFEVNKDLIETSEEGNLSIIINSNINIEEKKIVKADISTNNKESSNKLVSDCKTDVNDELLVDQEICRLTSNVLKILNDDCLESDTELSNTQYPAKTEEIQAISLTVATNVYELENDFIENNVKGNVSIATNSNSTIEESDNESVCKSIEKGDELLVNQENSTKSGKVILSNNNKVDNQKNVEAKSLSPNLLIMKQNSSGKLTNNQECDYKAEDNQSNTSIKQRLRNRFNLNDCHVNNTVVASTSDLQRSDIDIITVKNSTIKEDNLLPEESIHSKNGVEEKMSPSNSTTCDVLKTKRTTPIHSVFDIYNNCDNKYEVRDLYSNIKHRLRQRKEPETPVRVNARPKSRNSPSPKKKLLKETRIPPFSSQNNNIEIGDNCNIDDVESVDKLLPGFKKSKPIGTGLICEDSPKNCDDQNRLKELYHEVDNLITLNYERGTLTKGEEKSNNDDAIDDENSVEINPELFIDTSNDEDIENVKIKECNNFNVGFYRDRTDKEIEDEAKATKFIEIHSNNNVVKNIYGNILQNEPFTFGAGVSSSAQYNVRCGKRKYPFNDNALKIKVPRTVTEEDLLNCNNENAFRTALRYFTSKALEECDLKKHKKKNTDLDERTIKALIESFINTSRENFNKLRTTLDELSKFEITSIAEIMLEIIVSDNAELIIPKGNQTPPLSKTQKRLLMLTLSLAEHNDQVFNGVLNSCEETLASFRELSLNVTNGCRIIYFYTTLCRSQGFLSRARSLLYDLIYSRNKKSMGIVLRMINVWPFIIPQANFSESCLLTATIVHILQLPISGGYDRVLVRDSALLARTLTRRYGYPPLASSPDRDQLIAAIISRITEKGSGLALLLLARFYQQSYSSKLVENVILPLIREWLNGTSSASDMVIAEITLVIGRIVRGFSKLTSRTLINTCIKTLESMLEKANSIVITEAVVEALVLLRRHNLPLCAAALAKWRPVDNVITKKTAELIRSVLSVKGLLHWLRFLDQFDN